MKEFYYPPYCRYRENVTSEFELAKSVSSRRRLIDDLLFFLYQSENAKRKGGGC